LDYHIEQGADNVGPDGLKFTPQLVLRTALCLAYGRQVQKNSPVAEIGPADHILDPIRENRARRFKQHLLVVRIELADGEAAAGREPAECVRKPNGQAGQVVECEQLPLSAAIISSRSSRARRRSFRTLFRECTYPDHCGLLPNQ
jgi:hypothetical protein